MDGLLRLVVPVIAMTAVLGSGAWLASQHDRWGQYDGCGPGHQRGPDSAWSPGQHWGPAILGGLGERAPVTDLDEARDRAEAYAETLGPDLRVGEVMRFSHNFYAELEESDGTGATELLINPVSGVVCLEYGPAMMWNTRYGMVSRSAPPPTLEAADAGAAAKDWAAEHEGLTVGEPERFPGYYTLRTLRDGRIEGMLSVNASDGTVWYHGWHGDFVEMSEPQ